MISLVSSLDFFDDALGSPNTMYSESYPQIDQIRKIYFERLVDKVLGKGDRKTDGGDNRKPTFSETALPLLYKKILIENPLNQGLMLGDNFLSYDTGRSIVVEYTKSRQDTVCTQNGDPITVKEVIPIHIILQAEFFGVEVITRSGCEQGEVTACSRKLFAQGFSTMEDCGPDSDYPTTGI